MAEYHSIFFKQWLQVNGKPVRPEVTVMQFGIDETGGPQIIRTEIDHVCGKNVDNQKQ